MQRCCVDGDNFLTQLTLGGYDASQMQGSLLSIPMAPLTARDLVVGIQSITVPNVTGSRGSVDVLGTTGGINAFIDSTFPWIWLPESACMVFESAFGLLWNDTMGMYYLSEQMHNRLLAANPSVVFTLGQSRAAGTGPTVNITLPCKFLDAPFRSVSIFIFRRRGVRSECNVRSGARPQP